ncbi:MAG: glycosyltransferase family 2 protein [bacterium]
MQKQNNTKISCIIPAYNEEENISRVLDVVTTFTGFNEILVLDDGSTDNTKGIASSYKENCPVLQVITMPEKNGKAGVIKKGVNKSRGELIVMLDSDLIGLTHKNLETLISPVLNGEVDQAILDRAGDRTPIWGWTNCAKYFGGERAFWKKDFLEIDIPDNAGYLLEITNNLHYISNGKLIRTIFCSNLYTVHQFSKIDMLAGTKHYFNMAVDIVKKATIKGFVKQFFYIENQSMYKLFRFHRNHEALRPLTGTVIIILHLIDGISVFLLLNTLRIIKFPYKFLSAYIYEKRGRRDSNPRPST